jgi:hypothetical protein
MGFNSAESGPEVREQLEVGEFLTKLAHDWTNRSEAAGKSGQIDEENRYMAAVEAVNDLNVLVKPKVLFGEKINDDVMLVVEEAIYQSIFMPNEKNRLYDHSRASIMTIATYLNSLG